MVSKHGSSRREKTGREELPNLQKCEVVKDDRTQERNEMTLDRRKEGGQGSFLFYGQKTFDIPHFVGYICSSRFYTAYLIFRQ